MKKTLLLTLGLFFALVLAQTCGATTYYVAQSAGTFTGGSACNGQTAITLATLGSTALSPDDHVYFCGTITGAANSQAYDDTSYSGTSGHPITFTFDTNANLTAPYWNLAAGLRFDRVSYITVDGGTNGIIQNTQNGTGLTYEAGSTGLTVNGGSNITVKNLTIANICQHTFGDANACETGGNNDQALGLLGPATNITFTNNVIRDTQTGIIYVSRTGDSGIVFSWNTISRTNWDIAVGPQGASTGLLITGNDLSCIAGGTNCNWDAAGAPFHHNGIMIFPQSNGVTVGGVVISNNFIHDIGGGTGFIFYDPNYPSCTTCDIPNSQIYNNVFYTTPGQAAPSDDAITDGQLVSGTLIANNTILAGGGGGLGVNQTATLYNNVEINSACAICINNFPTPITASDYNDYYNITGNQFCWVGHYCGATLAQWVGAFKPWDANSIYANPNLTPSFTLNSGSPAIGKGKNLTSLGIAGLDVGAPQTFGAGGSCGGGCVARPATGAWDMGAYQTTGSSSNPPPPPTNVSAQVQ